MIQAVSRNKATQELNFSLIVDDISLKVLDSICKVTDLHQHHITLVQKLELARKSYPQSDAIYFVAPTLTSIKFLLNDFQNPKRPQYGAVHLFFLSKVPNSLFELLGSQKELVRRVRNFKEMNLNFILHGPNSFIFQTVSPVLSPLSMYAGSPEESPILLESVDYLFTVCTTLNEFPYIQYSHPPKEKATTPASVLAVMLHKRLRKFYTDNRDSVPFNSTNRAYLLILDRSFDLYTPVMHDLTFGQMVFDFLMESEHAQEIRFKMKDIEGTYKVNDQKDELWERYKTKHIVEVIQELPREAQEFTDRNKKGSSGLSDLEQLKRQPKQNDLARKYRACQAMATQIVQLYKERGIARLVEVEQLIISGVDDFGKIAPNRIIIQEISKMKKEIGDQDFL